MPAPSRSARPLRLEELEPRVMLSAVGLTPPDEPPPEGSSGPESEPNGPESPQDITGLFTDLGDTDVAEITGAIGTTDDQDAFQFTADEGEMILVSVTVDSPGLLPFLELFDDGGNLLKASAEPTASADARLAFVAPATGAYVAVLSDEYFDATGGYDLTVTRTDPTDVTGILADAGGGAMEASVDAAIDVGGDIDFYVLDAPAGQWFTIDVTTPSSDLDAVIEVFSPTTWWIAGNDDRTELDVDPFVETVIVAPGSYGVLVEGFDTLETGDYDLLLRYEPPDSLTFDGAGQADATAWITEDVGARIYGLGSLDAGTPIGIDLTADTGVLDAAIGLYRSDGTSIVVADDNGPSLNPSFDTVLRTTDEYFLVVDAILGDTGEFTIEVDVDPAGALPVRDGQVVFVDVDGRATFNGAMTAFDGADVGFAGQTQELIDGMTAVLEDAYAPYNVTFVDTEPVSGDYSVIVLGGNSSLDYFGLAESVDPTNTDLSEEALIYGGSFDSLQPCTVDEMGTALGNVAAHELGHLLGLSHVADADRLMDDSARADALLLEQSFGTQEISYTTLLVQDSAAVLSQTLGPWGSADADRPLQFTDANGDEILVEVDGPGTFFLVADTGLTPENGQDAVAGWWGGAFDETTQVTFTDLNPGVGGDDIPIDLISATDEIGGLVGDTLDLGSFVGTSLAAGAAGLQVDTLGALTLADPLAGQVIANTIDGTVALPSIAATGLIQTTGDFTGSLLVAGDADGTVDIGGNGPDQFIVGGHVLASAVINVDGDTGTIGVGREFRGTAEIGGNAVALNIVDDLTADGEVTVDGTLTGGLVGGDLAGSIAFHSLAGLFNVQGLTTGTIHCTGAETLSGQLRLVDDLVGTVQIDGDSPGTIWVLDDIDAAGAINILGDAGEIHVGDDMRGAISVGEGLDLLDIGDQVTATGVITVTGTLTDADFGGPMNGTVTAGAVDGSVSFGQPLTGTLNVTGALTGAVDITGDLFGTLTLGADSSGSVAFGDDFEVGAVFTITDGLHELVIGDDVKADLTLTGDVDLLDIGDEIRAGVTVDVTGALGEGAVGGELPGTLRLGSLATALEVGEALLGTVEVTGDADGDITIGGDVVGALTIGGNATGTVTIGDDIENGALVTFGGMLNELIVADRIKDGFTLGGDLNELTVGAHIYDDVDLLIPGDAGIVDIGGRLDGTMTMDHLLTSFTTGGALAGALTVTSTDDCAADITIGGDLRGTLDLAGAGTGTVTIGDDIENGALVTFGGMLNELIVADRIKDGFTLGGDLNELTVGAHIYDDVDLVIPGDAGMVDIGGRLDGTMTMDHLLTSFTTGGALAGALTVTSTDDCAADITIGGDLRGTLDLAGASTGTVSIGDDIENGALVTFGGAVNELIVADRVKDGFTLGGDLNELTVGAHIYDDVDLVIPGDAGVVDIGGRLDGAMTMDHLLTSFTSGSSLVGGLTITSTDDCAADITIGGDLRGTLDLAGASTGTVSIGDDIENGALVTFGGAVNELIVADRVKDGFTLGGDLNQLTVGAHIYDDVDLLIPGDAGIIAIGGRLDGAMTMDHLLTSFTSGSSLVGGLTITSTDDCAANIAVGWDLIGTLDLAGASTGTVSVGDDIGRYAAVSFGGDVTALTVADDIKTDVTVAGGIALLDVGETLFRRAAIVLPGDLGTATFGQKLNGTLTAAHLTGALQTGGSMAGAFTLTDADACAADIAIGWDLAGRIDLAGDHTGTISIGDDINGSGVLDVAGAGGMLTVADQVRGDALFAGGLASLTVGAGGLGDDARLAVGGDFGGGAIGGTVEGVVDVTGQLTGDLAVTGHLERGGATNITGGIGAGVTLSVTGDVRHDLALGAVLGDIQIGDDVRADLLITGDLTGNLDVADDASADITITGDVYGDVTIGGDLHALASASTPVLEDPDVSPVDYVFQVLGVDEGTLTVGGAIGTVV